MIRLAVPILIILVMLAGAVWAIFGYLDLPPLPEGPKTEQPLASKEQKPNAAKPQRDEAYSVQGGSASFDIARIDPDGTSVFAGRAEPGAQVTIIGDGQMVGTADVDENGEWTFAGEHKFSSAEPKLGLRVKSAAEVKKEAAEPKVASRETKAGDNAAQMAPSEGRTASAVTSHMLKNLEGMVEEARTGKNEEETALKPEPVVPATEEATPGSVKEAAPSRVTAVNLEPSAPAVRQEPLRKSIPVPITFIFDEANFTGDGRKAAGLLLEYLKLKHFPKVTLTGHADERGTEELNMNLSRERLDTVAHFLREGGYKGELELIPKGESEPFTGVVRSEYSQEDLWQLDRRVELVIAP